MVRPDGPTAMPFESSPDAPAPAQDPTALPAHARGNLRLTAVLLGVWFLVTFGVGFFARELDFTVFGWPFSFWMGAQGALVVYVLITAFYAGYMNRRERRDATTGQPDG